MFEVDDYQTGDEKTKTNNNNNNKNAFVQYHSLIRSQLRHVIPQIRVLKITLNNYRYLDKIANTMSNDYPELWHMLPCRDNKLFEMLITVVTIDSCFMITYVCIHNTSHGAYTAKLALFVLGIHGLSPFLWWMLRNVKSVSIIWRSAMDSQTPPSSRFVWSSQGITKLCYLLWIITKSRFYFVDLMPWCNQIIPLYRLTIHCRLHAIHIVIHILMV